jgi:hypothetical protein
MADSSAMAGAGIFLMALAEAFNVYGALNSSPWTAENFGADPEKAASCRRYVIQADIVNVALGVGTSIIAKAPWPLLGILAITVYMHYMYERALKKGAAAGSAGWANASGAVDSAGYGGTAHVT